jgi:hypothetical protein
MAVNYNSLQTEAACSLESHKLPDNNNNYSIRDTPYESVRVSRYICDRVVVKFNEFDINEFDTMKT